MNKVEGLEEDDDLFFSRNSSLVSFGTTTLVLLIEKSVAADEFSARINVYQPFRPEWTINTNFSRGS